MISKDEMFPPFSKYVDPRFVLTRLSVSSIIWVLMNLYLPLDKILVNAHIPMSRVINSLFIYNFIIVLYGMVLV